MDSPDGRQQTDKIPSRWLKCPPKSFELLNDKFLIFKTPLSRCYDSQVKDDIFLVDLVFQSMKNRNVKLGLWVDLTNTYRYYDRSEVERNNCDYVKLKCEGHGGAPSADQTLSFIELCHNFIQQNPMLKIGVHCTHGFNRSGFLVISYLVEMLAWDVRAAIAEFARIRPPGIYKQDYLNKLYENYDDVKNTPNAPPLPDWCFEAQTSSRKHLRDFQDDDDDDGDGSVRSKMKKVESPSFMEGITDVEPVTGPLKAQIDRAVRELCGWRRSDFPGCQPVSLSFQNIKLLSEKPYHVSWKADGVRYMLYIKDENEIYCIDRDNNVFLVKNMTFPKKKDLLSHVKDTLLDGEMVLDKLADGTCRPRYLVYDAISMFKYKIMDDVFTLRHKSIKKEICDPREEAKRRDLISKKEPFSVRLKDFMDIEYAGKFLNEKFKRDLAHPPDGLIFQPSLEKYVPGQCKDVLKWKPLSLNSVDFRLKIITESGEGIMPRKVGKLYTGGDVAFGELNSIKNVKHLDSKIIECTFDSSTQKWVFMRERTDKSFPNSYETAIKVCESIRNPISEQYLLEYIAKYRYRERQRGEKNIPQGY